MKAFLSFFIIALAIIFASGNKDNIPAKICKPGSHFKVECNDCVCSKDGTKMICTEMFCLPKWGPLYIQGTPCPGKTFYSECNQCVCGRDGRSAVCTLIACSGLKDPKNQNAQI